MAIKNLQLFQQRLDNFSEKEIPTMVMRRQVEISLYLLSRLQSRNPVDTGFSRSNWRMEVDNIPNGTLGTYKRTYDLVKRGYRTFGKNRVKDTERVGTSWVNKPISGMTRDEHLAETFFGDHGFNATEWRRNGHVIYVFNNVQYMYLLVAGRSKKVPKNWFHLAVQETKDWIASKGW